MWRHPFFVQEIPLGISAKIIEDSISPEGKRLTTFQLRYPLIIHAESKTHRLHSESGEVIEEFTSPAVMSDPNLSRNARSQRAVPIKKMIQEVMGDPFIPLHWGKAQPGMQAFEECDAPVKFWDGEDTREDAWLRARDQVVDIAEGFADAGYHKQLVNRLLSPWLYIDTLVSATEYENFFALRDHEAAEPHIRALAKAMKQCLQESIPSLLEPGQWHLPYTLPEERESLSVSLLQRLSVSRCARISYTPFDGNASIEKELERYELLVGSVPGHFSPTEHQGTPDSVAFRKTKGEPIYTSPELHGNLKGWCQYRKLIDG